MRSGTPTVAVIGLGAFGALHLEAYLRAGARVVGVADRDIAHARRVAHAHGIAAAFADGVELVDALEPNGVSIVTPAATHLPLALHAVRHGCRVLLEKPIARTADELATVSQEVRDAILPGHVLRFDPVHRALVRGIAAGRLGRVLGVSAERVRAADHRRLYADVHIARMTAVHDIDLIAWLTGSPVTSVVARTQGEPAALLMGELGLGSGALGQVRASWLSADGRGVVDDLAVYGEEGVARLRVDATGSVLHGPGSDAPWAAAPPGIAPGLDAEIEHFLDWISGAAERAVDFTDAAAALAVADALIASAAAGGRRVPVGDGGGPRG